MPRSNPPGKPTTSMAAQIKERTTRPVVKETEELDGNMLTMTSTGSTLLDLAITGGRKRGGGIPGGIFVEVFGPNSSGKTTLLCEIGGNVQLAGGDTQYHDPEARLNTEFARMFGYNIDPKNYWTPDVVPEVFSNVRGWKPAPKNPNAVNGIFADSLAALSTHLEMDKEEGDKMGQRRAKEFSEQLRRTCRVITKKNYLMVCSNQIRENVTGYGPQFQSPGGWAIGFYASLRLRAGNPKQIPLNKTYNGKVITSIIGIETEFFVHKSSVWKPYHSAPVYMLFDYGIDDIRGNLQYIKDYTGATTYVIGGTKLASSMEHSIALIEKRGLIEDLREEVINLWEDIEKKFEQKRIPKH